MSLRLLWLQFPRSARPTAITITFASEAQRHPTRVTRNLCANACSSRTSSSRFTGGSRADRRKTLVGFIACCMRAFLFCAKLCAALDGRLICVSVAVVAYVRSVSANIPPNKRANKCGKLRCDSRPLADSALLGTACGGQESGQRVIARIGLQRSAGAGNNRPGGQRMAYIQLLTNCE